MGSALAQIIRCMRGQGPASLPASVGPIPHDPHSEHAEAEVWMGTPNLMLWTGTSHIPVLTLKEDE